jgi:hypothetical protein
VRKIQRLNDKKIQSLFKKLVSEDPKDFPRAREKLDAPTSKGVYLIISPSGNVLHVGSTPRARNGLHQRLKDHLRGSSSFAKNYLDGEGGKLRSGYKFIYVKVVGARQRAILECYAIGQLQPAHLGTG